MFDEIATTSRRANPQGTDSRVGPLPTRSPKNYVRFGIAAVLTLSLVTACGGGISQPPQGGSGGATSSEPGPDGGGGTSTSEPPPSEEFMVTINGFNVINPTWYHAIEVDGKGDEVYFSVGTKVLDANGNPILNVAGGEVVHRSVGMGDTNEHPERLACGSRSSAGGIQAGDWCMIEHPWEMDGIGPQPDRPPMKVAQVTLTQGQENLVVSPTIWEWDGPGDAYNEWVTFFQNAVEKVPPGTGGGTGTIILTAIKIGLDIALQLGGILGTAADRPIGISSQNADGTYAFNPYVISLTYDSAYWLVNNDPSGLGKGSSLSRTLMLPAMAATTRCT
jgi:hypothetical protein